MKEIFKQLKGWEHRYFVSNKGRVKHETKTGLERKTNIKIDKYGNPYIYLTYYRNDKRCTTHRTVASLVLEAFVGGYYKKRPIKFKDGNIKNVRLTNLSWEYGFQGNINESYVENLVDCNLSEEDKYLKYFLLTDKFKYIKKLVMRNAGLYYTMFVDYRIQKHFNDYINEFTFYIYKWAKEGRLKPLENSHLLYTFLKRRVRFDTKKIVQKKVGENEVLTDKNYLFQYENKGHITEIYGDYEDIGDEISEMFSNLC